MPTPARDPIGMNSEAPGSPAMAYLGPVLEAAPRLLGTLDREPLSPTWGSFDRDHWAWKFRDFPLTMLQGGLLPLAWLWRTAHPANPWHQSARLHHWLVGSLEAVLKRQRRNGAFDGMGPNTQDHGITLAQCYLLGTSLELLREALPGGLASRLTGAMQRATAFGARSDEDYAFISNHQALFALAWLQAGNALGDASLIARADAIVARIVARQSPDGWYPEYGGPDPGYESLGLQYLAEFHRRRPDPALLASLERSVGFLAHLVQPDGGVGGGYGSRHTVQWYPAGFELLAPHLPVARAVADFLRPRLPAGQVVTPVTVDSHNLPVLLYSYCLAADAAPSPGSAANRSPLPCEVPSPLRHFPDSGVVVASTPHYFAIGGLKRGGVLAVFDRARGGLVHEDAGYVAEPPGRGTPRWSSALLGLTTSTSVTGNTVRAEADFGEAARPVLTPGKFVLLRLLNLTLFRSLWLGALIRRTIIAQLISGRRSRPLRLIREVTFGEDAIAVRDQLVAGGRTRIAALWRPRAFTAVHMGSARYYHPRDLVDLPEPDLTEAVAELRREGRVELTLSVHLTPPEAASGPQ